MRKQPIQNVVPVQQQNAQQQPVNKGPSLNELMKQTTIHNMQFQYSISANVQDLQTQIGQLATTLNNL